jgi:uncharacterized protein (TIGR03663 family)
MKDQETDKGLSLLNRPLAGLRIRWQTVALLAIVAALLLTRLWALGNRAYSHDESAHAWEAWKLVTGQRYIHDPVFHGPFLYHLTALMYFLFGVNDVTARLGLALLAVAVVLLVWPLRRWLGHAGAVFAMLLLTISPTLMFRGRFIRHDIVVMTGTMVMVLCFFRYLEERKAQWLYIMAAALAVSFCGKANAYINGAILGTFWALHLAVTWLRTRKPLREIASFDIVALLGTLALPLVAPVLLRALGFDPIDYSSEGLLRIRLTVLVLGVLSALIGTWWKRRDWLVAAGIYYSIFLLLYTTLLTNARGVESGFVGMLGYWLSQQDVARGGQPWYYYFFLLLVYELLPLLMALLGAADYTLSGRRRESAEAAAGTEQAAEATAKNAMVPLLLYWVALNLLIFTWSGEKMPWQNQHLVVPLGLLGGWFLGRVWEGTDWRALVRNGALQAVALMPVLGLALAVLVSVTLGQPRPFAGMDLQQLQITLRWALALIVSLMALALLYRYGRRLGWTGWSRALLAVLFVVLTATTVRTALRLSFINQNYATEFLVFAAATPDTALVMEELDELARRMGKSQPLQIAYDNESQQPFFWYLRDRENVIFFTGDSGLSGDPHVVIVGPENEAKLKAQLAGRYTRRDYRLIWWPDEQAYRNLTLRKLWQDLRDPARRRYWWDVLWDRKYPQSTTAWPLVHKFALYMRRDVAALAWASGAGVAPPDLVLPTDEYEQKRVDLSALQSWGSFGSGAGQLDYPKGLAVDAVGNTYVADSYNHRVQVFDTNGRFVRQWGSQGNGAGQFQEPWGIAVDSEGMVFVADTWNHRVQKFDAQGRWLMQWGVFGDTGGALGATNVFYGPRDIAVDPQGNVWVSDTGNKRIVKFTAGGDFLGQWGGDGVSNGQFREPVGLAIDGDGSIYVADTWNERVQKFDPAFNFVAAWPVVGWEGESVTNKPYLAVDSAKNVYVTGPDYHWVVQFDPLGRVRALWGQFGSDLRSLNMPSGIAIGADDSAYVLDSANHRVLKFAPVP